VVTDYGYDAMNAAKHDAASLCGNTNTGSTTKSAVAGQAPQARLPTNQRAFLHVWADIAVHVVQAILSAQVTLLCNASRLRGHGRNDSDHSDHKQCLNIDDQQGNYFAGPISRATTLPGLGAMLVV
jgi:hypothetical protein